MPNSDREMLDEREGAGVVSVEDVLKALHVCALWYSSEDARVAVQQFTLALEYSVRALAQDGKYETPGLGQLHKVLNGRLSSAGADVTTGEGSGSERPVMDCEPAEVSRSIKATGKGL